MHSIINNVNLTCVCPCITAYA